VRALVLIVVIAGCAPDATELRECRLDGRAITLPARSRGGDLPEQTPYRLHATVALAAADRDSR
jgi:hypothetical protein